MSRTGLILSLVVAVGLGLATLLLLNRNSAPLSTAEVALTDFDPARVSAISFEGVSGYGLIERTSLGWRMFVGPDVKHGIANDEIQPAWPVDQTRMRAALTLLSRLEAIGPQEDGLHLESSESERITFFEAEQIIASLQVAGRALGGRALAQIDGRFAQPIEGPVHEMLVGTGPLAWRSETVFQSIDRGVSEISIKAGNARLDLSRTGDSWNVIFPIAAPADGRAIDALLMMLASVNVQRHEESIRPGIEKSPATVRVERIHREIVAGKVQRTRETQQLAIGGPADVGSSSVFVRSACTLERDGETESLWGPCIVVVDRTAFDDFSTNPLNYVSRTALAVARADIGSVTLPDREFRLTVDGWRSRTRAADIETRALLDLLTSVEAVHMTLDGDFEPLVTITIGTLSGDPLATVTVSVTEGQNGRHLVLTTGPVHRIFGANEHLDTLDWIQP